MALHARNIAMAAGTPTYLVEEVVNYMKTFNRISLDCAKMYLEAHELFTNLRMNQNEKKHEIPLSTFFVKIKPQGILEPLVLHVAFDCWNEGPPLHYSIEQKSSKEGNVNISGIGDKIFGAHDFDWLNNLFQFLEKLKLQRKNEANIKSENSNTYKIKLLAILLNIISFNLAKVSPKFQQKALFLFQNILQVRIFLKRYLLKMINIKK